MTFRAIRMPLCGLTLSALLLLVPKAHAQEVASLTPDTGTAAINGQTLVIVDAVKDKSGRTLKPGDVMYSDRSPVIKAKVEAVDERVVVLQPKGGMGGPVALDQTQLNNSAWRKI